MLPTHPHLRAEVEGRVELYIHLLPLWAFVACSMVTFTFTCTFRSQRNGMARRVLDSSGSGYVHVVGCCEHGNEPSGAIKCGESSD